MYYCERCENRTKTSPKFSYCDNCLLDLSNQWLGKFHGKVANWWSNSDYLKDIEDQMRDDDIWRW